MDQTRTGLPSGIPRDVGILAARNFLWGLGEGLYIFFYPLALQQWQINTVQIGAVLSFLGMVMVVVQALAGYLSDRFGARPLIRAACILGVIAAGMMAAANSLPLFIAGLVVYSINSFINAPLNSYVTQMRGGWSAQRAISFVAGAFQAGGMVGPMLGGWIGQSAGLGVVFRYATGFFLVATVIAFFARPTATPPAAPPDAAASGAPRVSPLSSPRLIGLLAMIFLTMVALRTPLQLTPVYLQDVQRLSLQQIGLTGTFAGVGGLVILFALGSLQAPAGMITGQALLGLFCLFLWRGQSAASFYIGHLFVGGTPLYRAMATVAVRPLVKESRIGLAYGLVETGNALAVILAPLAAGVLYQSGPERVYSISLIALVVTTAITAGWFFGRRKATTPA